MNKFLAPTLCFILFFIGCKENNHSFTGNQYLFCSTTSQHEVVVQIEVPSEYFALLAEANSKGEFGPAEVFVSSVVVNKGERSNGTYKFKLELIPNDEIVFTDRPFTVSLLRSIVEECSVRVSGNGSRVLPPDDPPEDPSLVCSVNTNSGAVSVTVDFGTALGPFTLQLLGDNEDVSCPESLLVLDFHLHKGTYTFELLDIDGSIVASCIVDVPGPDCNPPPDNDNSPPTLKVICHQTPSGHHKTLVLPVEAAEAHLREHSLDYDGSCEDDSEHCSLGKDNRRCVVPKCFLSKWLEKHWVFCSE